MRINEIKTDKIAESLLSKYFRIESVQTAAYPMIVALHALCRLAVIKNDKKLFKECRQMLAPYIKGEITHHMGAFIHYHTGGNATAFLAWNNKLEEAKPILREHCEKLINEVPRGPAGFLSGSYPGIPPEKIWIDKIFAVVPFLLFTGLIFNNNIYLDEACRQIRIMNEIFRDPENGLYHQCYNWTPGKCTEDHWSRGNGWGILALTEMANYLPQTHGRRREIEKIFMDHLKACLAYQGEEGLWRQEMTRPDAFMETSGSGFILYALGVALEKNLLDRKETGKLIKGLRGMTAYIGLDSSLHNTCSGCCHPGQGTIADYMARPHPINDAHGFGPVSLAFGQAYNIGIKTISIA